MVSVVPRAVEHSLRRALRFTRLVAKVREVLQLLAFATLQSSITLAHPDLASSSVCAGTYKYSVTYKSVCVYGSETPTDKRCSSLVHKRTGHMKRDCEEEAVKTALVDAKLNPAAESIVHALFDPYIHAEAAASYVSHCS